VKWEGNEALPTGVLYGATRIHGGRSSTRRRWSRRSRRPTGPTPTGLHLPQHPAGLRGPGLHRGRDLPGHRGEPSNVHDILITGNTRTKERVIRRSLVLRPGDLFRRNLLVRSQRELQQLGYFNDIQVNSRRCPGPAISISSCPWRSGRWDRLRRLRFSSSVGLTGFIELGHSNLFGNGQSLNLRMERGQTGTNAELSLTEPWFLGTPTSVGVDLYNTTRKYRSTDLDIENARIGGRSGWDDPSPFPTCVSSPLPSREPDRDRRPR